jgi:hypothetical protein
MHRWCLINTSRLLRTAVSSYALEENVESINNRWRNANFHRESRNHSDRREFPFENRRQNPLRCFSEREFASSSVSLANAADAPRLRRRGNSVRFHADKAVNISLSREKEREKEKERESARARELLLTRARRAPRAPCAPPDVRQPHGMFAMGGVIDRAALCFHGFGAALIGLLQPRASRTGRPNDVKPFLPEQSHDQRISFRFLRPHLARRGAATIREG